MKGRVRRNTWVDRVLNNSPNLLVVEQRPGDWYVGNMDLKDATTTVFVCDDARLAIGSFTDDGGATGRCVMRHEKGIFWENYGQYFPSENVRIATCYMKYDSDIEEAARELTEFIILKQIYGNVLLVGYGKSGLMMYRVGTIFPNIYKIDMTVMTIATPFADLSEKDNQVLPSMYEPLPEYRNHIAFIKNSTVVKEYPRIQGFLRKRDKRILEEVISVSRQKSWPYYGQVQRRPELVIHVAKLEQISMTKMVLSNFGQFAAGNILFSDLEKLGENSEFRKMVAYSPYWDEE